MTTVQSPPPPALARSRAAVARALITVFGVRLTSRSGRHLAAASAVTPAAHREDALEAARRQLQHLRMRIGVLEQQGARGGLRPRLIAAVDHLQEAARRTSAERSRLEASLVAEAIPDPAGPATAVLMSIALVSEGYLTYSALSESLPDQPVALLLASIVAAPLATLLTHRGGTMARRMVWSGQTRWYDGVAIVACLLAPALLGVGIVASRLVGMPPGNRAAFVAALAVGAGLQGCLLGVPAITGWLGADPVPGLTGVRKREARLTARLARAVRQLQESIASAQRAQEQLDAQLAESLASLDYWATVFRAPVRNDSPVFDPQRVELATPARVPQGMGGTR